PVHVVLEVEHFRETRTRDFALGPRTVLILHADEVLDTALHTRTERVIEREQAHDGPSGLRGGARPLPFVNRIVVGVAAFAPAAIGTLHALEPVAAAHEPGLVHVHLQGTHAAQDLPGAVDVVHPPPAIPGAVVFLLVFDELDAPLD